MMTHITIKIKEVMMIIDIPPPANPAVGIERHTISYMQPLLAYYSAMSHITVHRHRKSIGSANAMLYCVKHGGNFLGDDSSVLHAAVNF